MRNLAKWRRARRPARSRCRRAKGTVHEIAHQVKPDGALRSAVRATGSRKKMRMAPCRASIRLPFPTSQGSFVRPATAGVRDTVWRVVNSPPADARLATQSTMNLKFSWPRAALPSGCRSPRPRGSVVRPATGRCSGDKVLRMDSPRVPADARRAIPSTTALETRIGCRKRGSPRTGSPRRSVSSAGQARGARGRGGAQKAQVVQPVYQVGEMPLVRLRGTAPRKVVVTSPDPLPE